MITIWVATRVGTKGDDGQRSLRQDQMSAEQRSSASNQRLTQIRSASRPRRRLPATS